MLEIVRALGSMFLIVTFLLALVAPTRAVKDRDAGLTVTGWVPVPLRATLCGLLIASSVMVRAALLALAAVGAKIRLIVQEDWNGNVAPQVDGVCRKSPLLAPVTAMEAILTRTPVLFVTVTVCAVPVLPSG